jgi:uncharacterized protein
MTTNTPQNDIAIADKIAPVSEKLRFNSLDVLRGVAVLAIFAVNIKMMANGYNHYVDRTLWKGDTAPIITFLHSKFIHGKFVTIFTALFGAGLVLLVNNRKTRFHKNILNRLFWLAVFGAMHLIFIREGDILIWYALVGFIAVLFTKMSTSKLFIIGALLNVISFIYPYYIPIPEPPAVLWSSAANAHLEIAPIMLGPAKDLIMARIDAAFYYMGDIFIIGGAWIGTLSTMILGMGLLKNGFLTGKLSAQNYFKWGLVGFIVATLYYIFNTFLDHANPTEDMILNILGSLHYPAAALTWSSLIIGIVRYKWKGKRLAAVGRMAFTVYILQSVIGLLLFSSLGLGLYGQLSLSQLMVITLVTWLITIQFSYVWLQRFHFGPLEWLWRSLTYKKMQRFRRNQ